jgi:hypothetical protein
MSAYTSEEKRGSTASALSTSSVKNAFKSAARRYKEHNRSVQAAYESFYGINSYRQTASPAETRRASEESTSSVESAPRRQSSVSKAWDSIKERAHEHHTGVNNAYAAYYGVKH